MAKVYDRYSFALARIGCIICRKNNGGLIMKNCPGLMLLLIIQLFFLYLGNSATLSKTDRKTYNKKYKSGKLKPLFLKISGLYVFSLEKRIIYKLLTVLIYFVFFTTLAVSCFYGTKLPFLKDLLIKTDFAIIPVLIIVNYLYSFF